MSKQLLPPADELQHATSTDLLEAAKQLLVRAFDRTRDDVDDLTKSDLLEQVRLTQQIANSAAGTQTARIAQAAGHEDVVDPLTGETSTVRHHLGWADDWIDTTIAPLLALGPRQASVRVQHALDAVTRAPSLLADAGAGRIDPAKIGLITDQLAGVTPKTARLIELALIEQSAGDLTTTQLRRRLPKLIARFEPTAVDKGAERRRKDEVGVFARPHHEPGLTQLIAILPTAEAIAAYRAIDDHARQLQADDITGKALHECRADAFLDLLLGNVRVSTEVVVQLPVEADSPADQAAASDAFGFPAPRSGDAPADERVTDVSAEVDRLLDGILGRAPDGLADVGGPAPPGTRPFEDHDYDYEPNEADLSAAELDLLDEHEARLDWGKLLADAQEQHAALDTGRDRDARFGDAVIPGFGVIPAGEVALLARALGTTISRVLTDADTGATLETSTVRYRPTAGIKHFVTTRDGHCRFPGCTTRADRCDIDHVLPWPTGATTPANLQCLCRHHHRAKQQTAWTVRMTADGTCFWTSASGREYCTTPGD